MHRPRARVLFDRAARRASSSPLFGDASGIIPGRTGRFGPTLTHLCSPGKRKLWYEITDQAIEAVTLFY
jgi:hypothetical protein